MRLNLDKFLISNQESTNFFEVSSSEISNESISIFDRWNKSSSKYFISKNESINISPKTQYLKLIKKHDDRFRKDFNLVSEALLSKKIEKGVVYNTFEFEGEFNPLLSRVLNEKKHYLYGAWSDDLSHGFLGLSPELLWHQQKEQFEVYSLAATGSFDELNHPKYLEEQGIVTNALIHQLSEKNIQVEEIKTEKIKFKDFYHLKSTLSLKKQEINSEELLFLQPTPAIGGHPKFEYQKFKSILEFENKDEFHLYGGVFMHDLKDYSRAIIMIRNLSWENGKVYIHAGCGVTTSSNLNDELDESHSKISSVMELLGIELN